MSDIHIRAILLIVMGVLCIGGAVGLKLAGALSTPGLLTLTGMVAFAAAGWLLFFCED